MKVIKRLYEQHHDIREIIDSNMVDVCREKNISLDQAFSALLLFAYVLIRISYSRNTLSNRVDNIEFLDYRGNSLCKF